MKTIYKLTDQDMQTYGGYQWQLGEWHETSGAGALCGAGWFHAYEHPLLAVLHNPVHTAIHQPRLFECEYEGEIKRDGQTKCGVTKLRLVRELEMPEITTEQRVSYAIYCAKEVYDEKEWNAWADAWLSGNDRSLDAAADAAAATWATAAWATARAAAAWAADAARAAARAADDAAADAAARAADDTADAAWTAARASTEREINLVECAEKAMLIGEEV